VETKDISESLLQNKGQIKMATYELLGDGRVEMTKPIPDQVESFTIEDLRLRHASAVGMMESFKTEANDIVDLMIDINTSPDIVITIIDIPEKIK